MDELSRVDCGTLEPWIAGGTPTFWAFEGDDDAVRAYIADVNLERRDLKKGQKATALAMLFPEATRGMHSQFGSRTGKEIEVSRARLSEARACRAMLAAPPPHGDNYAK